MEKVHLVVDLNKCVGCFNCMVACKDEHVGNSWLPYTEKQQKHEEKWINPVKHERGTPPFTDLCYVTEMCQHCAEAPCEKTCPDAVHRRPDGIVLLDPEKAKGNPELVKACPFGMISWNEELETAQKCTMCAHLLDAGWKEPRCVQACPLRALSIVRCEDSEFDKLVEDQKLKPLYDGNHQPRVLYRNLYRYTTCFISGALAYKKDGVEKAAADAAVRLKLDGEILKEVHTDFFGEFKIDRIPKNSGTFEIEGLMPGYRPVCCEVTVKDESPCLNVMYFEAS
ncbi:Fe-S-cluster-containing dehydrogenase component [Sporobacter termitidis DSM 10068]|uniref:Fe-S-cluster-containing dehydrogenase component n=1 Tax=Sporobacter termitidis DSM 10068 TaxID=1123282 RepID=A0A1M5XWE2_9FIRM|nr:4Fe-4S dicluster domain-containing protein [Sporobacter termitidis]SHI03848.1 Fe-S-cluster-containing dehydrogenase component [Sporobacter termitidis DSM 10068]